MFEADAVPVLLLKTKSLPEDGYEQCFSHSQDPAYSHCFVPVLEHTFNGAALSTIERWISTGAFSRSSSEPDRYGGIIFTSQRAVEAFIKVVASARSQRWDLDSLLPATLPLYVVGPATARSLRTLELQCPILGEEAGNGGALADFILQHYNTSFAEPALGKAPLLFLVGEQRRDIIPRTLQDPSLTPSNRIKVDELTVYETGVMASFPDDFRSQLQSIANSVSLRWVVVFSPTGCKAMLEVLGMLDRETGKVTVESRALPRKTMIVTIGPTTRDYLVRTFDFEPDACAAKPSPEGVVSAMRAATRAD